jgi:protocatechuate 3,4-dioxygenase beta subunit
MRKLLMIAALGPCMWGQTASVEGLVTNSLTGERLARAHVILKDPANKTGVQYGAQTTDEGKFSVAGIAPGSYLVSGERVGFGTLPSDQGRARVTLKADDKKSDLEVKLTPVGVITGRVTDAEGEPVERASVIPEGAERKETSTDENGWFRIGGLAPGKYRVKAAQESEMYRFYFIRPEIRADGTTEVHNATTYYPGVLTAKQAGKVEVRPGGESTGIDIQLVGVPFVRVSGKVAGMPRGAPQAYASISWRWRPGE